jgi:hypothetical protein
MNGATDAGDGLHAEFSLTPDCPVAELTEHHEIVAFTPGRDGRANPQFVLAAEEPPDDSLIEPVVGTDETVVCRVRGDGPPPGCGQGRCLSWDPTQLPVAPFDARLRSGRLRLSVAATDGEELRATMAALDEDGFDATPERVVGAVDSVAEHLEVVDLSSVTDRQRELAAAAAEQRYFSPEGPSAATLAEEFDIAPGTLSEHLRTVQAELFQQLFKCNKNH